MLPQPSVYFTLPSIHDDSKLDCRVFHPESLASQAPNAPRWGRHVAIVAHPYAPLGGSYDDPIVDVVAGTLLEAGFMVATFNFRGASSEGNRTSWTSKPERADYMSVVGFIAYYAHYIDIPHRISADETANPILLMAGYSYGAMIVTKLPPLETIMAKFQSPVLHTPAADIRLRAQHLAERQSKLSLTPASPRKSLGMRVGGDEDIPHKSHDIRRSHSLDREDRIRKGVKDLLARTKIVRKKHGHKAHEHAEEVIHEVECMAVVEKLPNFQSSYLVVSPPVGLATNLTTMSFANPLAGLTRSMSKAGQQSPRKGGDVNREDESADRKLADSPSMVVYGSQDGFLTMRKFREWSAKLRGYEGSQFRDVEVPGAGHFYAEEGVLYELREAVDSFGAELLGMKSKRQMQNGDAPAPASPRPSG